MNPEYITIHNTANNNAGADAEMHSRYLSSGKTHTEYISWHFTVDDSEIIQHLPLNEIGYHAGDGVKGTGNNDSIAIEICENADGNYRQAEENAESLVAELIFELGIDISHVVPHKHWSGKECPENILNQTDGSVGWDQFIANISSKVEKLKKKQQEAIRKASMPELGTNASIKQASIPDDGILEMNVGENKGVNVYTTEPSSNYSLIANSSEGIVVSKLNTDTASFLYSVIPAGYNMKLSQIVKVVESSYEIKDEMKEWKKLLKDKDAKFTANDSFFNTLTREFESSGLSYISVEKGDKSVQFVVYSYIDQAPSILFTEDVKGRLKSSMDLLSSLNTQNDEREWTSSDDKVAVVKNGVIRAVKKGKAKISVKIGEYIIEKTLEVK